MKTYIDIAIILYRSNRFARNAISFRNVYENASNHCHKETASMKKERFMVRGVFLDLDGTIVDSKEAYLEAARVAFETLKQKPLEPNAALEIPKRLEQGFPISDIIKSDKRQFLRVYLETYYSITWHKTKLITKVAETLELLSNKAKLALITMRFVPRKDIVKELEYFGISKYFTYVVTALDTPRPKPSPEALIECVKALDVDICSCIMAGDSVNDVRAGKAAGAKTVAVLSGLFQYEELVKEDPDLVLNDVNSLPMYIE
jgi:HAD superfamily hydrolase (TIGR01509 family)